MKHLNQNTFNLTFTYTVKNGKKRFGGIHIAARLKRFFSKTFLRAGFPETLYSICS
jgi:hypothetical protein